MYGITHQVNVLLGFDGTLAFLSKLDTCRAVTATACEGRERQDVGVHVQTHTGSQRLECTTRHTTLHDFKHCSLAKNENTVD